MLRLVRTAIGLVLLMVVAGLAAWIADQPGRIRISWFDHIIEAPAPLLALGVVLLVVAAFILTWIVAWAVALPQRRRLKRQAKGYANFAAGMVAVAAGEADRAAKLAAKAQKQLDDPALARLLAAHAAQLAGRNEDAQRAFTALSQDPGTAFLGTRGLLADARGRGDRVAALQLAARASALRPASPFAAEAELRLLVESGDWAGARKRLEQARRKKAVSREAASALDARLDLAEAQAALHSGDLRMARQHAEKAARLLPEHPVPPLLLARAADHHAAREAAAKLLRVAFARRPSEALANAWLALQQDVTSADLLARAEAFVAERRPEVESRLLLAAAALQAHDFAAAREALDQLAGRGGSWAARLQARLAQEGDGDDVVADRWRASIRSDLWQCGHCGTGHAEWHLLCPDCGSFDSLDPTRLGEAAPLAAPPRPLLLEKH
ncbi:heme biosynthesis HemY N-terminal domain-containing protein [Ferrovibrio sp.]|jgi:HemY protein|uniref:heme biosynthesis HemY N-terminal domain-containing protein n=1 Tax=Ferrovibrio sp. TaxID=1917215 RepID=UPI0035B30DBF